MKNNQWVWEQLIASMFSKPLNFVELQKSHQIKKLELQKFTAADIKLKRLQFQQRYEKEAEDYSKNWMENQYRVFVWFVLAYANLFSTAPHDLTRSHWEQISHHFKKHPIVCQYFYLCSLKNKTQAWETQQDDFITKMMNSNMNKKWTEIGLQLFRQSSGKNFRKPKTIRERWLSHLNPEIKRSDWSAEEDLFLLKKIKEIGKKWSKIAKIFGNRSEHTVKNRYNKIVLRKFKKDTEFNHDIAEQDILENIQNELEQKIKTKSKKTKNDFTEDDQSCSIGLSSPIPMQNTSDGLLLKDKPRSKISNFVRKESLELMSEKKINWTEQEFQKYTFEPIILISTKENLSN